MVKTKILNFSLTPIAKIEGLTGASGILGDETFLYIISDDSNVLYAIDREKKILQEKISLLESGVLEEHIEKKLKPDFEAGFTLGNHSYIFGSGSTEKRMEMVVLDNEFNFLERISVKNLYRKMMEISEIGEENFNLEGIILKDKTAWFFNRGNGPDGKNGIIKVNDWQSNDFEIEGYFPLKLPEIQSYPSGFSDAVLCGNKICFLATSEKTLSVYDDGEVAGSLFGIMDLNSLEILDTVILTKDIKLEGLYPLNLSDNRIELILCDDADGEDGHTDLFLLEIQTE